MFDCTKLINLRLYLIMESKLSFPAIHMDLEQGLTDYTRVSSMRIFAILETTYNKLDLDFTFIFCVFFVNTITQ